MPETRLRPAEPTLTPDLVAAHGLKPDEYQRILDLIGREPTFTELGIFSAMWNEHCSYKSSRIHLRTLPTKAPWVIQGPGENAGVIDIGDGDACVFKMESHNHPSYIEPYQGAATGVGGILRDVFTMGARPIACLNLLRFGDPSHPKTKHLVAGVVAGIGGYGNSFGVPTVGGSTEFHTRYDGNILVNAMAVGLARADAIFYAKATGVGNPIVYLGSKTGRDGIHGATMASASFEADAEEKRPTVQVGDPFAEKLLLEACLELMRTGAVVAIQDMGAAGLTSSAVEMGAKGDLGIELDLDAVPCRETGMSAYEMMLSESQERMLMVLHPEKRAEAEAVFVKWGLDFAVVGKTTDTLRFVIKHGGETKADLPIKELGDQAPLYDRPHVPSPKRTIVEAASIDSPVGTREALLKLLAVPDLASKRWVWEQYDHLILGNSVITPGGDAAVVRIGDGPKGLALTTDVTQRYCEADPYEGGKQAVAEAWRNITATGALPRAVTDNLNFGNPEKPEVMGQFVDCVRGIGEACRALDFPIVSGNVSLYNESAGRGILPTPSVGGVGVIADVGAAARVGFMRQGNAIILVGETHGWLGQSLYLREICGREDGAPPPVDLALEKVLGDFVRIRINEHRIRTAHDVSDGGIAVALAEMALAGDIGATVELPAGIPAHAWLFGEDQARYLVTAPPAAPNYEEGADWLCRPGRQDVCAKPTTATVFETATRGRIKTFKPNPAAPIDCFYVYPTVSKAPGVNAPIAASDEEIGIVREQFAPFTSVCRPYAPLYRQITRHGLRKMFAGKADAERQIAYGDVLAAWRRYLAEDNAGRGVVLIGHSQGANILTRLLKDEIDGKPIEARIVSAIVVGGRIDVPDGKTVGGTFRHVSLCETKTQTSCVIAYSSYPAAKPMPADAFFGATKTPGMRDACISPMGLAGAASLEADLPVEGEMRKTLGTDFSELPGLIAATCRTEGRFTVLAVGATPGSDAASTTEAMLARLSHPVWGLHALDLNLALGTLVELVRGQSAAYARK